MSTTKILSTSALAHSASSLQIKHEKSLGINHMKHWSELDAALETQNHQKNSDIFALHHSELNDLPCSKPFEAISFLDSDDDFENEDVGGIDDDFDNREPPQRLHGTPLLAPRSQLSPTRTFINLSANGTKTIHLPKASQKIAHVQLDRVTVVGDELGIFATGKCTKTAKDPVIRKGVSHAPKQPAVVHRGLPSSSPCPDLCPMSLKLLCSNEMPKSAARVSPSGSPLKHPFRIANMKKGPVGNIEAAVQVFKVDVNLPNIPQMCDSKSFRINRMQGNGGKHHATTTPAATVSELQCEKHDLPPLGEARPQDYWGQETLLDGASQCVTQPPRDYGLIIHLALNRPK